MDGMDNNQNNPNQDPNTNLNQVPNQDQNNTSAGSGSTYWEEQAQSHANQAPEAPVPPQVVPQAPQTAAAPHNTNIYNQAQNHTMQPIQQPKKSRKGLAIAGILLVLVLAAAGTAFAFKDRIFNTLSLNTKDPYEYYTSIEKKNIHDAIDKLVTSSGTDINKGLGVKSTLDISYDKDTINSYLQSAAGVTLDDIKDVYGVSLDSLGMDATIGFDSSDAYLNYGLRLNNTKLISLDLFINTLQEKLILALPELSSAYLSGSFTGEMDFSDLSSMSDFKFLEDLSSKDIAKLLKRYADMVLENLDDVEVTKNEELEIDDLSVKTNMVTVTVDAKDASNILKAILTELKNDEFFLDLFGNFGLSTTEYRDGIDEALDSLSSGDLGNIKFIMDVYIDSKGNILGRDFSFVSDGTTYNFLRYAKITKGDKEEYSVFIGDKYNNFVIEGAHTKKKDAYTGDLTLTVNIADSMPVSLSIDYSDAKTEYSDNTNFVYGKYSVSSPFLLGFQIDADFSVKNKIQYTQIKLNMGKTALVTIDTSMEILKDYKVPTVPSNAVIYDAESEIFDYLLTVDYETYINNLAQKLGFDANLLLNYIEAMMMSYVDPFSEFNSIWE